jgi:hypothetical protein
LDPITEVTLERTPCFGGCPVDKVTLRSDGTAVYTGTRFVERTGQYKGTFSKAEFDNLTSFIDALNFNRFQTRYARPVTDLPSVVTTVARGAQRKAVTDYGNAGPISLWGIEKAVLGVASNIRWADPAPADADRTPASPARLGDGTSGIRGIVLDGPITLEGTGSDRDPKPVPGAAVVVRANDTRKVVTQVKADSNGRFEVSLPPGTYLFGMRDPRAPDAGAVSVRATVNRGVWRDMVLEYIVDADDNTVVDDPNQGDPDVLNAPQSSDAPLSPEPGEEVIQ